MLKTLNVTDSDWTVPYPHLGSIGKQLPFPESCEVAAAAGFDAVNLDVSFAQENGGAAVLALLEEHKLKAAAFRFPVKITDEGDETEFERGLAQFEVEAVACAAAGFHRSAMHILPWSLTDSVPFGEHFRLAMHRLERVAPILRELDIQLGLEFLGSFGNRRTAKHDFVHTVEGIRCLAAAAGIESHVGLKLDIHHWWATGGLLEELVKLSPRDVVYVELNDSLPSFSRLATPEFQRDLPLHHGMSDSPGVLAVLQHIGYDGPVVCEPFNRRFHDLTLDQAVDEVKSSLDECFRRAAVYDLPADLVSSEPYNPDPQQASVRAGGLFQD